jgi:hypothetical protein
LPQIVSLAELFSSSLKILLNKLVSLSLSLPYI